MRGRPTIHGDTVRLVPLSLRQAEAIQAGEDTGLTAGRGWPHADTAGAAGAALASGDPDALPWAVVLVDEGVVIGDLGWKGAPPPDGEVEIGYGLAAPYRGRGLGAAAVATFVDWLRAQPDVRRVVAETVPDNTPSRRLLERLGFELVSVEDSAAWYRLDVRGTGADLDLDSWDDAPVG